MNPLFERIEYDFKSYSEQTDSLGKQAIEDLATKLKSLEIEILNDPKGRFSITKSGNIFSDSFEPSLAKKISNIIAGH